LNNIPSAWRTTLAQRKMPCRGRITPVRERCGASGTRGRGPPIR
jgi:hypothetical protein